MDVPFRFRFRVRYGECDPQGIVFNARWGDYVDLAATELTRRVFGGVDPAAIGIDWRLVRQLIEWKAPARFDDVIEATVTVAKVGTTSFTLATGFARLADGAPLVTAETVYVCVDASGHKQPLSAAHRDALGREPRGVLVDHAGSAG